MASNYNARRRPAELIVDGAEATLVRRRETLEDLVRGEEIPGESSTLSGDRFRGATASDIHEG
jgi:diaminopimelate decarboxylase